MFNHRVLMAGVLSSAVFAFLAFPCQSPAQSLRKSPPAPSTKAPANPAPANPAPAPVNNTHSGHHHHNGFNSGGFNSSGFNSGSTVAPAVQTPLQNALTLQANNRAFLWSSIANQAPVYPTFPNAFNPNPWLTPGSYSPNSFQANSFVNPYQANSFMNPYQANSFVNPYQANPFMNPYQANPFMNPYQANPFAMNPFQQNPFANPVFGGSGVFGPGSGMPLGTLPGF